MSDSGAPYAAQRPLPPPVLHLARIDPPPAVQAAVGAALRACHAWQPVAVPPRAGALHAAPMAAPPVSVEATICETIDDWPHNADQGFYLVLGTGVGLGFLAAATLLLIWRVIGAFGRTTAGFWLRDRLGEPSRVLLTASIGALVGTLLGSMASAALSKRGVHSVAATDAL